MSVKIKAPILQFTITKMSALCLSILASSCLIFAVSCGCNTQHPSGELPVWKVGDTWTIRASGYGDDFTLTHTVTGEHVYNGIDCYTTTVQYSFNMTTDDDDMYIIHEVDKTTMDVIGSQYAVSINGIDGVATMNTSYSYSTEPYPLTIGKTWTAAAVRTGTEVLAGQSYDLTETGDSITYEIEKAERITVPAGTFLCFKIVAYNSDNSIEYIYWVSDETAITIPVKVSDIGNEGTIELVSYSLAE